MLREVAWALAYAHGRGIVHRDIKPDNILLERGTGRALVTDFGIAHGGASAGDRATRRRGQIIGTAHFMSPEQAAGEPVDGRSDLYALGGVGFFALTGRAPFEATHARGDPRRAIHARRAARRVGAARRAAALACGDRPLPRTRAARPLRVGRGGRRRAVRGRRASPARRTSRRRCAASFAPPSRRVWLALLIVVFTIIYGLPTTRRRRADARSASRSASPSCRSICSAARASCSREGFGAADVRRGFEIERQAHAEEMRQLFDARRTAARRRTAPSRMDRARGRRRVRVALQFFFSNWRGRNSMCAGFRA